MRRIRIEQRVPWHVVLRGARRLQLFHDVEDFQVFLSMLRASSANADVESVAYALLSNHGHLGLLGSSRQLTECMWHLDRGYSGYHNKKYRLQGHTFDRSYFAKPVRNDFVLLRVARYIHLNPVRAGLATRPEDYRWSDYPRLFRGEADRYAPAQSAILAAVGGAETDPLAAYVTFVEAGLRSPRRPRPSEKTAMELWQEQFNWILELAESRPAHDRLDATRAAIVAAANAGIPPRAIGMALGHEDGLQVSQILYRSRKLMTREPAVQEAVAALDIL